MPTQFQRHDNTVARRFSQVCIISLAALITSGLGMLAYLHDAPCPPWLKSIVLASAIMVGVSFAGWLIASLAALARGQITTR